MKVYLFIIGRQCSGKTTVAKAISDKYNLPVLHVGEMVTEKLGDPDPDSNLDCPAEFDELVLELVEDFIDKNPSGIIEGAPRNDLQIEQLLGIDRDLQSKAMVEVIRLWAPYEVRKERYYNREIFETDACEKICNGVENYYEEKMDQFNKREDGSGYYKVVSSLRREGIEVKELINYRGYVFPDEPKSDFWPLGDVKASNDPVQLMTDLHRLQTNDAEITEAMEMAHTSDKLKPLAPNTEWLKRFIHHARDELDEMEDELPEKWWSNNVGSVERARAELVDVLHFVVAMSWVLGMKWHDLMEVFRRKFDVNFSRMVDGDYCGTNQGDDKGIGELEC